MAATKQFLLNYDSNILLPYTTLDCILGKEDDDPNEAKLTGISVITDELLKNIEAFVNSDNVEEGQINASKISNAYVLGISTLKEGNNTQVYTKFHELNLASPQHAGQYLGADGLTHDVSFGAKDDNGWYSTSIAVKPSRILDDPIKADVSININISNDCFETSDGQLYSKYSTRSTSSNVTNLAQCTLNKIVKADSSNWDASIGSFIELESFGPNVPIQLNNGILGPIKGIGGSKKPIYIDGDGIITQFSETVGTKTCPVYLNGGELTACNEVVGNIHRPIFYDGSAGFKPCSGVFGSNTKFAYISNGEFAESDASIGSDDNKPIYLKDGVFTEFSNKVPTYSGTGVGDSSTPIYIDSSGHVQACTYKVGEVDSNKLIYASGGKIHEQSGSAGGPAKPVFLSNGTITEFSESVGDSSTPVYLDNGKITRFSDSIGNKKRFVYVDSGTIKYSDASIGNLLTPVYLDNGTIEACDLEPQSIKGAKYAGQYLMSDASGVGIWGPGNTTTAGSFDNNDGSVYYLVGINTADASTDGSFTHLTGAKKSDGTGIYFKNYELFQTSDENLKTFTDEIDINFDNLATIKKGIYHWTDDPNKISDIGIGARSIEALYPEIVDENDGVKTVAYNRLGVIALAAIDKLHLRVKELETEMKELKAEIRALKQGK